MSTLRERRIAATLNLRSLKRGSVSDLEDSNSSEKARGRSSSTLASSQLNVFDEKTKSLTLGSRVKAVHHKKPPKYIFDLDKDEPYILDFEKLYQSAIKTEKKKDSLNVLFMFPKNDLLLIMTKRTVKSLPKEVEYNINAKYGQHLASLSLYNENWYTLERICQYNGFSALQALSFEVPQYELGPNSYMFSTQEISESSEDTMKSSEKIKDKLVVKTKDLDSKFINMDDDSVYAIRETIYNIYGDLYPLPDAPIAQSVPKPHYSFHKVQFIVEPKSLSFQIGNIEPYFLSMVLFDMAKKTRLSETFYFDFNDDETIKMIGSESNSRRDVSALFSVAQPSTDIWLVVRVEKILQGETHDQISDTYSKYDSFKEKDKEKLGEKISSICDRLSEYRQPFCWGAIALFNDERQLAVGHGTTINTLHRYKEYASDQSFFEGYLELSKANLSRRNKTIPGRIELDIYEPEEPHKKIVVDKDGDILIVPSNIDPPKSAPTNGYIQEIASFPAPPYPFLTYSNNLYVYPLELNLTKSNASITPRNIGIEIRLYHSDQAKSIMKAIYNRSSINQFTTKLMSNINYHNKTPQFYDEFKIALPSHVLKHNLVFTFYHIACQNKKVESGSQIPVGYAFVPLAFRGRILDKIYRIPVISSIPTNYLTNGDATKSLVIDAKKAIFKVNIKSESTLYPVGGSLNAFFRECTNAEHSANNPAYNNDLIETIKDLSSVSPHRLLHFLPTILNQLFYIMCNWGELSKICFEAMVSTLNVIYNNSEKDDVTHLSNSLTQYADYLFISEVNTLPLHNTTKKKENVATTLYFYLTNAWIQVVNLNVGKETDKLHRFSWFYFKLIYLSMACKSLGMNKKSFETLREKDIKATVFSENRTDKFPKEHLNSIRQLVLILAWQVHQNIKGSLTSSKDLNRRIALFLSDLMSVVDRGFVFDLISKVMKEIAPNEDDESLNLRLIVTRILATHEHFPQLNLPLPLEITKKNIGNLTDILTKRHFLAGLVMNQIFATHNCEDKSIRMKAIHTLQTVLFNADNDYRLRGVDNREAKGQYIQIFFPFVLFVIDQLEEYQKRDFDEQRCIFLSALHIINEIDIKSFQQWWKVDTFSRLLSFLNLLMTCSEVFEFIGVKQLINKLNTRKKNDNYAVLQILEEYYSGSTGNENLKPKSLRERRLEATKLKTDSTFSSSLKNSNVWKHLGLDAEHNTYLTDEKRESNISNEVSFILLRVIKMFIDSKDSELNKNQPNILMDKVISIVLLLLSRKQTTEFINSGFTVLKYLLVKYSLHFFSMSTSYCGKIVPVVLKFCNFQDTSVRSGAAALLFLMMKYNYETSGSKNRNITRVKVQTIISLSGLIATHSGIKDTSYLTDALSMVRGYASKYFKSEKVLIEQVDQLIDKLGDLLEDNSKIKEHEDDSEMKVDLFHRIAQSYKTAPDLRVTWLQSLATFHEENNSWAEAAQSYIHIAALISEYLQIIEPTKGSVKGAAAFELVSVSAVEEQTMIDGKNLLEEERVFETNELFKEEGLIKFMETAIECLIHGHLYEAAIELYKLVIPVYEKSRDYTKLAKAYDDMSKMNLDIMSQNQTRIFGSYYRVGFYGELFGELDEQEYIYKEPKITRLGEIQDRLVNHYSKKFGVPVEILTNSGQVDISKLDKSKCYIQLTSVSPYLEEWELKERVTQYDRNNNINRFIFETPFTRSEKSQTNNLDEQMKRKTILHVETSFPYVKNRLKVVTKDIVELSPIQNSLEIIMNRTRALRRELEHPNIKSLQNVLQGSVRLQVHAGPQEICKTFLDNKDKYDLESVEKLKLAIQEFLDVCAESISKNKQLINSSQLTFHEELEEGLKQIVEFVEPYLYS